MPQQADSGHPDVQINLGAFPRISGRDYIEMKAPDSIKMVLALTPSAQLDDMTVDQEHLFPYRFGFDANRSIRTQIIALKHQYDLTDMDIRSLRHAGQLIIRGDQAKLAPNRLMPTLGWIYFLIFSFVFSVSALVVSTSAAVAWRQNLGLAIIAAMWLAALVFVNKVHLEPWRLLKRAGLIAPAS
ncbi:hypothetical protein [Herbaspirillum huttiense]|uniref:hypothetical protein n=1 Tax=Herbaspirillum huttiense TaxID=863372 RepID=UPI0039B0F212